MFMLGTNRAVICWSCLSIVQLIEDSFWNQHRTLEIRTPHLTPFHKATMTASMPREENEKIYASFYKPTPNVAAGAGGAIRDPEPMDVL